MELDLIYSRHNLCDIEELLEVMFAEIADSDCFYFFWAREMFSMLFRVLRKSREGSRSNDPSGRVGTPESLPFELNDTGLHLNE
jgi:hypothetical protein